MRIISQNGNADFPYESVVVAHADNRVVIKHDGKDYIVAEYSSGEKAYKAMEMLREAYVGKLICQNIDMTKDVEEILKSWNTQAIIVETAHNEPNIDYINNTIFQFPKDENVEVDS